MARIVIMSPLAIMRPLALAFLALSLLAPIANAAQPYLVADLHTKPDQGYDCNPWFMGSVNGAALFTCTQISAGASLWRSDGTAEGTV